jgi:hypothetical protein
VRISDERGSSAGEVIAKAHCAHQRVVGMPVPCALLARACLGEALVVLVGQLVVLVGQLVVLVGQLARPSRVRAWPCRALGQRLLAGSELQARWRGAAPFGCGLLFPPSAAFDHRRDTSTERATHARAWFAKPLRDLGGFAPVSSCFAAVRRDGTQRAFESDAKAKLDASALRILLDLWPHDVDEPDGYIARQKKP